MANLPQSVRDLAERTPVEDVLLAVLGDKMPDVPCNTLIKIGQTFPFILARRDVTVGDDPGDSRFIDKASVVIECMVEDPDGDADASTLAEAVRVALRQAGFEKTVYPWGHIQNVTMTSAPRRAPDWATSSGPVQYADLPTGVWRYETRYTLTVRTPTNHLHPTP